MTQRERCHYDFAMRDAHIVACLRELGLPADATFDEAHSTFRRLVLSNHPDKAIGDEEAKARYLRVVGVYRVLRERAARDSIETEAGGQSAKDGPEAPEARVTVDSVYSCVPRSFGSVPLFFCWTLTRESGGIFFFLLLLVLPFWPAAEVAMVVSQGTAVFVILAAPVLWTCPLILIRWYWLAAVVRGRVFPGRDLPTFGDVIRNRATRYIIISGILVVIGGLSRLVMVVNAHDALKAAKHSREVAGPLQILRHDNRYEVVGAGNSVEADSEEDARRIIEMIRAEIARDSEHTAE